jgi:hypothetical protein
VMTYLVENEQAALIIPARLLSRIHPHFRVVMQLLATQAADEARRRRLAFIGFPADEAAELSALHTRNFM